MTRSADNTLSLFPSIDQKFVAPGHTCHARDCGTEVKPELLMCLKHWRKVPRPIQRAVWAAYRPGQCDDKQPSKQWLLAADAAIGFVARAEGKLLLRSEQNALKELGFT